MKICLTYRNNWQNLSEAIIDCKTCYVDDGVLFIYKTKYEEKPTLYSPNFWCKVEEIKEIC